MSKELKKGEKPGLPNTPDGDQKQPTDDPDVARQTALAEKFMHDDREMLRTLAKREAQT